MSRTTSQTTTITNINRLPVEVLFLIIKRLPIKNKFFLKAVCKKWYTLIISHVLPKQDKLSIEKDNFSSCKCIDPDHQFNFHDKNSIPVLPVRTNRNRKRFFEKEVTGVKVIKFCGGKHEDRVMKYYLSEGPSSSLECLDVLCLQEPLVKVFPNLQHFSSESIDLVPFVSVLQYCPVLTHLSIDTTHSGYDFVDILMKLPKGLQYLKLGGRSSDFLAVFCSPAMETLESVLLGHWAPATPFHKPGARVQPAPRLQRFSMSCCIVREQDRRMIVDFMKECPSLKNINLRVTGLTLEDYVNIYSRLSNLEMININLTIGFDEVLRMILLRNQRSLKYIDVKQSLLNLETMTKLAEFTNLQTLSFCSKLVKTLGLSEF